MITESALEKWASAPSPTEMAEIKKTRDLMEEALKQFLPIDEIKKTYNLQSLTYEVYLQGSYKNSTNIRFDSDIDIVVQVNSVFWTDKTRLSTVELQSYDRVHKNVGYDFSELKKEVFKALEKRFNNQVEYKDKCLKIEGNKSRVDADIVPCFQYKIYKNFISLDSHSFLEGIKFYNTGNNEEIINFPKIHYRNGCAKNKDTGESFKSMVRVFKNFKREIVEKGIIDKDLAPSYFVENLIYNCTSHCFDGDYTAQTILIFQFLEDAINDDRLKSFVCANEQNMLFDENAWELEDAKIFIKECSSFYINN